MSKVVLGIRANEGYHEAQVKGSITVGDLKRALEDFDEDAKIVTQDLSSRFGATFGSITYQIWDGCDEE